MKFKIIYGDKWNIDFSSPIEVTEKQRREVIQLLNSLFAVVQEEEVEIFRDWRIGGDRIQYPRNWTKEEYSIMLGCKTIDEAVEKLGRSWMSIIVQSGVWIPSYYNWFRKKGKDPLEWASPESIGEFMKEHQDKKLAKRKRKSNLTRIERLKKEIPKIEEEIKEQSSIKEKLSFTSVGKKAIEILEELQEKKGELCDELRKLEKEIGQLSNKE